MTEGTGITQAVSQSRRPDLERLASLFVSGIEQLGSFEPVGESDLPPSYAALLAHHDHMTVTLEAYHESLVKVQVVAELADPNRYARQSLLARHVDDAIVQYGIMRIDVVGLPSEVRNAIESRSSPLGRILIKNNLLREVELLALWKIDPSERLAHPLCCQPGEIIYGRSAAIHLAGQRTVDLLEIVTDHPVPPPKSS